jgi:hypothetical protein
MHPPIFEIYNSFVVNCSSVHTYKTQMSNQPDDLLLFRFITIFVHVVFESIFHCIYPRKINKIYSYEIWACIIFDGVIGFAIDMI